MSHGKQEDLAGIQGKNVRNKRRKHQTGEIV